MYISFTKLQILSIPEGYCTSFSYCLTPVRKKSFPLHKCTSLKTEMSLDLKPHVSKICITVTTGRSKDHLSRTHGTRMPMQAKDIYIYFMSYFCHREQTNHITVLSEQQLHMTQMGCQNNFEQNFTGVQVYITVSLQQPGMLGQTRIHRRSKAQKRPSA